MTDKLNQTNRPTLQAAVVDVCHRTLQACRWHTRPPHRVSCLWSHLLHSLRLLRSTTPSPDVQMISEGRAMAWRFGMDSLNTNIVGVTTPVPVAGARTNSIWC